MFIKYGFEGIASRELGSFLSLLEGQRAALQAVGERGNKSRILYFLESTANSCHQLS